MKKLAAVLLLALGAASARAAIVSYEFTASVSAIEVPTDSWPWSEWVSSISLPGFHTEMGEIVTGTLTYDRSAAPLRVDDDLAAYGGGSIAYSIKFSDSGYQYTGSPLTVMTVTDSWWGDRVAVREPNSSSGPPPVNLELEFNGSSPDVLSSTALPWTELRNFERMGFTYRFEDIGVNVHGTITSLRLTSPVPEPASIGMLLAGLGAVALRRRTQAAGRITQ